MLMSLPRSERLPSRMLVALLVLSAQSILAPLAHASPPDPSWIPGVYDAADYDDVVLLVSSGVGGITPAPGAALRPDTRPVGTFAPSRESAPLMPPASAVRPRAPPAP